MRNQVKRMFASGAAALTLSACASSGAGTAAPAATATAAVDVPGVAQVLQTTWLSYARTFISADGRVADPERNGDTTSEGQSYAMLRAVWMNDRTTFDSVWSWTHANLWRSQRFAWLWNASDAAIADFNSATDADEDIALALLFAANRWHDGSYAAAARDVLDSVWHNDVAVAGGTPYVVAGNWAGGSTGLVIDPSYFAPYAYRIFATVDTTHDWQALVQSSYAVLRRCSSAPLSSGGSVGLPPNWCVVDARTDEVSSYLQQQNGDSYGYDAFRVMWRIALDAVWNRSSDALQYLATQGFLRGQWSARHALAPLYSHSGAVQASYDDPTVYGGDLGAFIADASSLREIVMQKLLPSLQHGGGAAYFGSPSNYFEQNWVWFGLALATGRLPNLAAGA